ncbi:hypothetical protein P8452_32091 [Trifolium repens]|nr:hypothetical protein P8452_32091 [Trifolium repens]
MTETFCVGEYIADSLKATPSTVNEELLYGSCFAVFCCCGESSCVLLCVAKVCCSAAFFAPCCSVCFGWCRQGVLGVELVFGLSAFLLVLVLF